MPDTKNWLKFEFSIEKLSLKRSVPLKIGQTLDGGLGHSLTSELGTLFAT